MTMAEVESKSPATAANEQPKNASANDVEAPQFPPQGPSGQPYPPPNFAFYNYPPGHPPPPPGPDGNPDPNAATTQPNGEPIPYPPPPAMYPYVYPQPPPGTVSVVQNGAGVFNWGPLGYMPVSMSGMPIPGALIKPKRKQVKMACTNCAAACKRCDVNRPCERCIKYGLADTCKDGVRKERKKGFKRGPYNKRKRSDGQDGEEWDASQQSNPSGEWQPPPAAAPPPFPPGPPPQGFPHPPEGYYPAFYAIPGPGPQLVPVPPGQSGENGEAPSDGTVDPNVATQNGEHPQHPHQPPFPPPHAQFVYPHLPHGYPPFGYPFPGPPPQHPPPHHQPPPQQSPQAAPPEQDQPVSAPQAPVAPPQGPPTSTSNKKGTKRAEEPPKNDADVDDDDPPTPPRKKRGRRTSDAEWPGTAKRSSKKGDGPATRRSSRRGQARGEEDQGGQGIAESAMNASNHDIVGSSDDPVVRSQV